MSYFIFVVSPGCRLLQHNEMEKCRDNEERQAKAATFNHLIDRTIEELTISDAEFNGIMSNLAERRSQMATGKASLTATHEACG